MKQRIKQIRKHFHLTQKELAEKLGSTTGFISLIETGRSGLSEEKIEHLCKDLHIRAEWLDEGTGPMLSDDPEDWVLSPPYAEGEADAVADRIKELRETLQLSQAKIGKKIGVSRELIAFVEQKRASPSKRLLKKIEETCNVNHDWLVSGNGDMFLPPSPSLSPTPTPSPTEKPNNSSNDTEVDVVAGDDTCCPLPMKDDLTFKCLEYIFPTVHPNNPPQRGYLIINDIPCKKCSSCGRIVLSSSTQERLDSMIKDLYPVYTLNNGFKSPRYPELIVRDTIIQPWRG